MIVKQPMNLSTYLGEVACTSTSKSRFMAVRLKFSLIALRSPIMNLLNAVQFLTRSYLSICFAVVIAFRPFYSIVEL